ncbi:hypothetical protein FQR65_LT11039 [Abscondita terminalis]|nr:hypothetical protein FQR65_LT11039 [Abscondita terminalis]
MVPRGLTQSETPFCEVCICTWFQNESPTINCISRNIPNIYDPKYWHDRMDNPYSMKAIIVNYNKLESLNTTFPFSNLKQLDLSRNDIKKIETGVFGRLQEMNTLILSRNKLEYINPHTFKGGYEKSSYFPLRSLKRLDLEYNELHTLDADTFEHIDELEEVNLSHNPLRVLDAQTVQALTSLVYLKTLNLAYTQLQNLPEFFLHTPKYLRSLDLSPM